MPHKLLLADDSITIQRVIELTFADEDVQVVAVGDGKKAIESIQSDRPDIVLADVGMPERDGYEVAEFIKRNPQLANIPVLLLTGAFEPIDETRARAVGCDGVLVKPFEPQMVINRVKDLLAGRRSGGSSAAKPPAPLPEHASAPADMSATAQTAASAGPATSASLEEYFDRLDAAFASVEAATEARSAPSAMAYTPPAGAVSSPTAAPAGLSTDDFPGWDPDLTGDPQRRAAAPAPMQSPPPEPPIVQHVAPPEATVAPRSPAADPIGVTPPVSTRSYTYPTEPPAPVSPPPDLPPPMVQPVPRTHAEVPAAAAASSTVIPSLAEAFAALLSAEQGNRLSPSAVGSSAITEDGIDEIVAKVIARMTDTVVRDTVIDVAERLVREEIERIKQQQ